MTFISFTFFIFLAVFVPAYLVTRGRTRLWVIFLASSVFYGWWDWRFLFLLYFTIGVDFFAARWIGATHDSRVRNRLLIVSLISNLGVLAFFKYFNFFIDSAVAVCQEFGLPIHFTALRIILPVGVSFYTFQSLSYTIDVWRREMPPEPSILNYATFATFFPQLVAGPIVRAELLVPQFRTDHEIRWESFLSGMQLVLWGLVMKCVVADSMALVVDNHFAYPERFSSLSLAAATVLYAFQIYGDFSGYSLIAIGIAQVFGYNLGCNFNRPYFSRSFSEFWQRWHISLSSWLRDYLYISLGGNRHGTWKTYRNLMLTMLLGGLWHGASWNFVIWGGLHGFFLIVQRVLGKPYGRMIEALRIPPWVSSPVQMGSVFALTCLTWIFFRAQTLDQSLFIVRKIVSLDGVSINSLGFKFEMFKGFALVGLVVLLESASFRIRFRDLTLARPEFAIGFGTAVLWMIALFGTFSGNSFIYFQF